MKNCEEIRELLSFYLDNELHENERKQVVKHLEGCDACKAELDQLKDMIEAIGEVEEVEMSADFGQGLHEKLVDAHSKSNLAAWPGKTNIYKWASAMVAGFVLLFAVVNSSYFEQLLQFSNNSKTAYVNDAHLNMVDKQAMDNIVQKQEAAEEKTQQDSIEKSSERKTALKNTAPTTQNKTYVSKAKGSVPANSYVSSNNVQQKVINQEPTDNAVIPNNTAAAKTTEADKMDNSTIPPKSSSLTLTVNDISGAVTELNNIVKENGGSTQEPQVFGAMSAESINETKDLTFQIPSAAYSKVMDSIEKIGTVQTQTNTAQMQPQIKSNSVQMESAAVQTAPSSDVNNMITVKVIIQKKQ